MDVRDFLQAIGDAPNQSAHGTATRWYQWCKAINARYPVVTPQHRAADRPLSVYAFFGALSAQLRAAEETLRVAANARRAYYRAVAGRDTLQSERDPFSRAFNQEKNDTGLPGDVVPRLLVTSPEGGGIVTNVPMCARGNTTLARLGDTRTNCTVGNGRLDEWDRYVRNMVEFPACGQFDAAATRVLPET